VLYLNEKDIKRAVSMQEMIDAIDLSYDMYHSDSFTMPMRTQIIEQDNTFLVMPTITKDAIGTKLVTVFPNNISVPRIQGLVILNSNETGEAKAILDGTFLTGYRTGAVGGSAIRHLAEANADTVSVIGTGVQGLNQTIAACTERPIKRIRLYNRTLSKIPDFIMKLKREIGEDYQITSHYSAEEAIKESDIIITATNSNEPVLPENPHLLKDKLIIGVGSFQPTMREFPKALYDITNKFYIDTEDAIEESGDLCTPLKNNWINEQSVQSMASYLALKKRRAIEKGKTIVFKSTGMALFDVVTANVIYEKASKLGIGQKLNR